MTAADRPPRVMDPDEVDDIAIDLANGTITPGLNYDDLVATVVAANQACANLAAAIVESWSDDQHSADSPVLFEGTIDALSDWVDIEWDADPDGRHSRQVRVVAVDHQETAR